MVQRFYEMLMSMEVNNKLKAAKSERTEERAGYRSGYRERRWDTQLGTMNLKAPKVREGGYIPSFLEPNKRIDDAVVQLVQEAYVKGVSTRKIEAVVKALGIEGISAGQVSSADKRAQRHGGGVPQPPARHACIPCPVGRCSAQ